MMCKPLFTVVSLIFLACPSIAQTLHERTWFFGGLSMHFDNGVSQPGGIPDAPVGSQYNTTLGGRGSLCLAVSDASGNLQFFTQVRQFLSGQAATNYDYNVEKVFDRNGNPFPHGNILSNRHGVIGNEINPIAVPWPGQPHKYFLFYSYHFRLMYSVVNMQLNNGLGDIEVSQKDIPLTEFGIVNSFKITTIAGCNENIWLLVRSRVANEYWSFEITKAGIDTHPVVSECGGFSLSDYWAFDMVGLNGSIKMAGGNLTVSPDGGTLAVGINSGIELYDFTKCNGTVSNARLLDTLKAYDLCFSPDGTKLYASHNKILSGQLLQNMQLEQLMQGEIFQYDLLAGDLPAIAASRTVVLRNPIYEYIGLFGLEYETGPLGAMKVGLDGKLYVSKNISYYGAMVCSVYNPGQNINAVPSTNPNCYVGQYMHVIHSPDLPGVSCNAELDFLKINDSEYAIPGLLLQQDITPAIAAAPDTFPGESIQIISCFRSAELLHADTSGSCYYWDDGSSDSIREVEESGTYWVRYFKDCSVQTDTFVVDFIELPDVPVLEYACPGDASLMVKPPEGSERNYTYMLQNSAGDMVDFFTGNAAFTLRGLDTGRYQLQIASGSCDTTITITIDAYPTPELQVTPGDTTIFYGDQIPLLVEGAAIYAWWPTKYLDTTVSNRPLVRPLEPTEYVVLGINEYGCRDTGRVFIDIDYNMSQSLPNAFSPNGDGLNDQFGLQGIRFQKLHAFRIYNRYGNLIFETRNPKAGWDGTFNRQSCETGTYFYYVELVRPDGHVSRLKGEVTLLR